MSDRLDTILSPIKAEMDRLQSLYASALTTDNALLQTVIAYLLNRNGKMMRPMLVFLCAKLLGQVNDATYHSALALELLHNASLVHDDVVDESDERRGQPSVNKMFNNKVAVLSGDFLLANALMHAGMTRNVQIIDIVSNIGRRLAEGELLQLYNTQGKDLSYDVYFDIIRNKTAILFTSAAEVAAVSVGAGRDAMKMMSQFCEYVGLCFQIRDDIFDYFDESEVGKPTGNDMLEGKLTLPVLYALNNTEKSEYMELALQVRGCRASDDEISRLVRFAKENGGIEYAYSVINELRAKALALLDTFQDSDTLRALKAYLDYCIDRTK